MTMVASAPFAIAKAIEGLGRGVMDAELNDRVFGKSKNQIYKKKHIDSSNLEEFIKI
jgi:hypothetical protein